MAAELVLDEAKLEETREAYSGVKAKEQRAEAGDAVTLVFKLPDGSTQRKEFTTGTMVAFVKLELEKACGIPMAKQTLQIEGRTLLDPLSLADCKGVAAGCTADVTVLESS